MMTMMAMRGMWRPGLLVLLAALALGAGRRAEADSLAEEDRLQFADGLYAREMNDLALKEYAAFLESFTNSTKADVVHFRMGECYRRQGSVAAADREFKLVFDAFPGSEWRLKAGLKRADLAMEREQYDTAAELAGVVLREKPPADVEASALYTQGSAWNSMGRRDEAVRALEQVRTSHASTPVASYAALLLGRIYTEMGRAGGAESAEMLNKAADRYRQAAQKPATDRVGAEALFQLAELQFRRREFGPSAESYRQLLVRYPTDVRVAEARLSAAWAAHNAGLYAEALAGATEALKTTNTPPGAAGEWLYLQANCQRQLLKQEEAVATYSQLLGRFPESSFAPAARYEKALSLYKLNRYRETIAELTPANLPPDLRKDAYWLLAESHAALREADNAIQYYRLIVRDYPDSDIACDATYRLAHQLQERGQLGEAAQFFSMVAARFPTNALAAPALFASAVCLAKEQKHAEAVRDWAAVVQKYPHSPLAEESLYQKGISEIRLRRDADALASLQQLLRQFAQSKFTADAHYWIGVLHREAERWEAAESSLRQALASRPREELAAEVRYELALTLQKTGKDDEAADLLHGLLASPVRAKFTPPLLEWLAGYDLAKADFAACVRSATLLTETNAPAAAQQSGWSLLGQARLGLGEKAAAGEAFRKCLTFSNSNRAGAEAALALGDLAWGENSASNAMAYYAQAASLAADDSLLGVRAKAYAGLARGAEASGDTESAARYYMSVAILFDDPVLAPECLFKAAEAFRKLGREDDARKTTGELRERYPQSEWAKRATP